MEGTGSVRESECFVQRVFLLSLPPSLFFLIHKKPTCQISSSNLVLMLVIVLKKILKLSDNMYSNKLSSVYYELIFFNKSLFTNYHFNRD